MSFYSKLEIAPEEYEKTKNVVKKNGSKIWEQTIGSRTNLFVDSELVGSLSEDHYLKFSGITSSQFGAFLGQFTKSLYRQIQKNDSLLELKIEFDGMSRDKNQEAWNKMKNREVFYNVDISSAYWQIAYRLGYITKKMFDSYFLKDEYKEAKRYCISFLARENYMDYQDQREIKRIECNIDCLNQVYENIRNELYCCITNSKEGIKDWIEYNIDAVAIRKKDLTLVCERLSQMNLVYKVNECVKLDSKEYVSKNKARKF